jgi:hypothetical protein
MPGLWLAMSLRLHVFPDQQPGRGAANSSSNWRACSAQAALHTSTGVRLSSMMLAGAGSAGPVQRQVTGTGLEAADDHAQQRQARSASSATGWSMATPAATRAWPRRLAAGSARRSQRCLQAAGDGALRMRATCASNSAM